MNHSTPGLPVRHKLPEFTQTHAHRVGDADTVVSVIFELSLYKGIYSTLITRPNILNYYFKTYFFWIALISMLPESAFI